MAQVIAALRLETDAIQDVLLELIAIREALFSRHGDRFRDMQRRIEALADLKTDDIVLHNLAPGHYYASAPSAFTSLLADARAVMAS